LLVDDAVNAEVGAFFIEGTLRERIAGFGAPRLEWASVNEGAEL